MTSIRLLAPSLLAVAVTSCASHKGGEYDTPPVTSAQPTAPMTQPANPIYDTPPAYEASGTAAMASTTNSQVTPVNPATAPAPVPKPAIAPSGNGAAIIHTVVAGDTLGGIAMKYKVSADAIKQANNMTKDTVVLGRKMVIPPAR